ncbi:hypothetical protein [Nonomuraea cavernae]|uniref:Lipoprotein n=1 Tax=Nonomuraea cavernae TaxID=2045107 RepID=A0A917ZJ64_9ACTN|nr:hypothetical protein [Nonomuraea cavernae]MCA2190975.1 hypothetical protein [Nonomuraea cavernae]GGO83641.1 hypothetical protein GCM10012289_77540 [Nonomuraea cavernae]
MRLDASSRSVAAILICFAVLTGCSGEPERPTLEEATRQLVNDGDALLSMVKADLTGLTEERANQDRTTSCTPGEIQRYFMAKGNFTDLASQDPVSRIGLLKGKLQALGYREVVDELDVWEDKLGVVVTHHAEANLTFVLVGRVSEAPNLVIVGKTECYPRAG